MAEQPRALSVTEAMGLARGSLERIAVRVIGEVSELTDKPGYKAVYFTIGDGSSVMPCLIWRDAFAGCGIQLRCGMLVEVTGNFTCYAPKGRMQFQARTVALAGEGVLRMQVAELARRLEAEGLMRPERKRPLPPFPRRIALVTSPRGKAVHDVIRTLRRRYPCAELLIAGVAVEGACAADTIVQGIWAASTAEGVDVLIVARGGGSYEDLMPFNAEEVARAIVASPVPVVTGIGHEPDTTIADMVADLRASTPTAAAEAVAPSSAEVQARLRDTARLLGRALLHRVQTAEHRVRLLEHRAVFADPSSLFATRAQALDLAAGALARALPRRLEHEDERLTAAGSALARAGKRTLERAEDRMAMQAARLGDLSPLAILGRGYAVCYDESGERVVKSASDVAVGDAVRVRVAEGQLGCRVETTVLEG